ncbi:MAG: LytR family transcriptional regulator [Chloroflexi bacterium]|nr:MAG: LytR family transcriptional regulator [Chloroflexota bacterium]
MAKPPRRARRSSYTLFHRRGWGPCRGRRIGAAILVVVGFVLSGAAGAVAYFLPVATAALGSTGQTAGLHDTRADAQEVVARPPGGAFTVLLLGSDDDAKFDAGHLLTQSMILVRVVPQTRRVTMLSIPRDLYVPVSTGGTAKIDTAFYGGPGAAVRTVERDFHVHVDHFVWVGLRGLVNLIDVLGGVDLITTNPVVDDFYPADLAGGNPYAYARVAVMPGAQHLNGLRAMEYVRSRHGDLREDFGRSERQQQVLLALRTKAHRLGLTDLPAVASALGGELKTDMSLTEVADLFPLAGGLSIDNVKRVVLLPPYTRSAMVGDQDVVLPDWSLIRPLVAESFS